MKGKKGGVEVNQIIGWGIAILVVVIFLLFYFYGFDWLKGAVDFVRNLVRFGG